MRTSSKRSAIRLILGALALILAAGTTALAQHSRSESADEWWAYAPLDRPSLPGEAHPIDVLIEQHLESVELEAAGPADPQTLLRRATFALTGLPPTPNERSSFLGQVDSSGFDAAWADLLDRSFASPHYGEAEARKWLDVVRYGETNGYERDSAKPNMWRYRDWVIRALQADTPYDDFVRLQLAGDEYATSMTDPGERADALLATGFYRLGLWDDEPADREQAAADERADIVDTISQTVFGSTLGCARCHDHKADPFSQAEYYALTAHFAGLRGYSYEASIDVANAPIDGQITIAERDARIASIDEAIEEYASHLPAPDATGRTLVADARSGTQTTWRYLDGDAPRDWEQPAFDASSWSEGPGAFASEGTPGATIGTEWTSPRIHLRSTFRLEEIPPHLHVSLHHDEDATVYFNGILVLERDGFRADYESIQLGEAARAALVVGRNVVAVECRNGKGKQCIDLGLDTGFNRHAEGAHIALLENAGDPEAATLLARRRRAVAHPVTAPFPAQVIAEIGPEPPDQYVHLRGSVHAQGDLVAPSLPAAWLTGSDSNDVPSMPAPPENATTSGRRRAFADWAFDGGAHITARVEANRIWQGLFGRGLCRTSGDFGRLGERPTHPVLLDLVAAELIARDWSRQSLQRWIMESRAYRRSSQAEQSVIDADPRNDHLAHFDPRRLTAEELRDAALLVSGELNRETLGPWVFPPLASEVLATASRPDAAWGTSTPEGAHRRSIYVHVKRSLREPLLAAFDQPDPDLPCPVRFPTNVPTQALLTLNGDFMRSRADAFAEHLESATGDREEQLRVGILRALQRDPKPGEIDRGLALLEQLETEHDLSEHEALALYALALLNRNEFIWVD